MIRDTAKYKPFMDLVGGSTPSLQQLSELILKKRIQVGEHNSLEDATASMEIYKLNKENWERSANK